MRSGSAVWHLFLRSRLFYLLAGALALATFPGNNSADKIEFSSPCSAPVHLLIHSNPQSPDSLHRLPPSQTSIAVSDRGGRGEVIAFPEDPDHSLTVIPITDWQAGQSTTHSATLNPPIQINLAFWLVCSQDSLESWIHHCESDMLSAMAMWKQQGAGITVGKYTINGVVITPPSATAAATPISSVPALSNDVVKLYAEFTCNKAMELVNAVDTSSGSINAFYVQEVHGKSYAGEACLGMLPSNNALFLGCTVSPMLLAHEIGHLLVLQHTYPKSRGTSAGDGIDWRKLSFSQNGVMFPAIKTDATITEGQILRLSLESTSVVNRGYGFHHGSQRLRPVGARNGSGALLGNKDVPRLDFRMRPD